MAELPAPTRDDLKDEVQALTAALVARGMTPSGLRKVTRRACKTGRSRRYTRVQGEMRIATDDDYLADLERAAIAIGNQRVAMGAVTRGIRDAEKE